MPAPTHKSHVTPKKPNHSPQAQPAHPSKQAVHTPIAVRQPPPRPQFLRRLSGRR